MLFPQIDLLYWISAIGFLALVTMGIDKGAAKLRKTRIRESTIWLIAIIGGFAGVILGGLLFHHKVSKGSFWPPVVFAAILWILLIYFAP